MRLFFRISAQYRVGLIVLLVTLVPANHARSATNDIVRMRNGDTLTGEVRSLERGLLRFNTSATGTISIEWDEVSYISSAQNIQVENEAGQRFLGRIPENETRNVLTIDTPEGLVSLEMPRVVLMTPIEDKGIGRMDGDVTFGYTYTKASEIKQLLFGASFDFRTETRILSIQADSSLSDSRDNDASQRQSVNLQYRRLWPKRWLTGSLLTLERNDELDLDRRSSFGGGGGRILRQTNHSMLLLEGGLMFSREDLNGIDDDKDTIEAFGNFRWDWYQLDSPELDLSTTIQIIPNLTETGRLRSEWNVSLKWEMIQDLFWELSVYNSFDSVPPVEGAERNDYGVSTSVGWEF